MTTETITRSATSIDLSPRFVQSKTVAASPSAATETTIATVTIPGNMTIVTGVLLFGWAAFTVGTNGTACTLKLRQTDTSGTTLATTGATTGGIAAASLVDINAQGVDLSPSGAQVYVLTLTVTGGSAASTVSAVSLIAIAV